MAHHPVPVTLGSARFESQALPGCLVTVAWFPAGTVIESHTHDAPTFATMIEGAFEVRFTAPGIRTPLLACQAGAVFTEPAGERHANHVGRSGARVVVLQPDPRTELPGACTRFLDRINHIHGGPIAFGALRMARELAAPDAVTPLAAEGIALEMLADAARLDENGPASEAAQPEWLAGGVEFLHDRFRSDIRVGDVAAAVGVHPAHLAAVFRRTHRVSIGTYVRRLRIEWAAEQLVRSGRPVSIIAAEAGFADQAHLTRLFKRATGWTPAAYRKARGRIGRPRS